MRSDSSAFFAVNGQGSSVPVCVVELSFSTANDDLYYLTSHADVDCPGQPINLQYDGNQLWYDGDSLGQLFLRVQGPRQLQNCVKSVSSTSQKLNVADFASTIGAISVEAVDDGTLTDYFRQKLLQGKTTSKNRLRIYAGFSGMAFGDMSLVQTQVVKDVEYNNGLMRITCLDIQRETKKTIFDVKTTVLAANINADDTILTVSTTSGFETVWRGPSYKEDVGVFANADYGFLIIGDPDGDHEIIGYSGKTGTTFTGCVRGALGTVAQAWEALDQDGDSNDLEVTEFVYLELPAAKLAYAILTGTLYGDAGKRLPDHWHLNIDEQWVSTSQFVTIGDDLWDISDDEAGTICYFSGLEKEDGRQFINKELMPLIGCFMPVSVTGELGLKRISSVISSAPYVITLDETNIASVGTIRYAQSEIINNILTDWSWDYSKEDFRRSSIFIDSSSAEIYGLRAEKNIQLKGLHGSRHSRDAIRGMFNSVRDRFSGEPIYTSLKLMPSLNVLEVGDIVRVNLQNWPDYTNTANLDRSFEVQGVTIDWIKGNVSVDLFGSSRKGAPLSDDGEGFGDGYAFSDALLTSEGSDIEVDYAANVSRSGDLVTVNSSFTFVGADALTESDGTPNPDCILYCDGDLLIPSGVTLTIEKNVILIVTGFLTVNGIIDGAGNGPVGGDYRRTYLNQVVSVYLDGTGAAPTAVAYVNANLSYPGPTPGYMHPGLSGQGGVALINYSNTAQAYSSDIERICTYSWDPITFETISSCTGDTVGEHFVTPESSYTAIPQYEIDRSNMFGLPSNLQGAGGPAGRHIYTLAGLLGGSTATAVAHGTSGGAGGAGLVTITRGMAIPGGIINLSGTDAGATPQSYTLRNETFFAGVGCGGTPGCWLCIVDGGDSDPPIVSGSSFVAEFGAGSSYGVPRLDAISPRFSNVPPGIAGGAPELPGNNHASNRVPTTHTISGNYHEQYHRVQFVLPSTPAPGEETPSDLVVGNPGTPVLTENTNTPPTPAGNLSSIDVYVPPATGPYSHSIVDWRYSTQTAWNTLSVVAQDEVAITSLPSDGSTIIVRARSVSTSGVANESGPTQSITLSTVGSAAYRVETSYDPGTNTVLRVVKESDPGVVPLSVDATTGVVTIGQGSSSMAYDPSGDELDMGAGARFSSLDSIASYDLYISKVNHLSGEYVEVHDTYYETWYGTDVELRLTSGSIAGDNNMVQYRAPENTFSPIAWDQDFTIVIAAKTLVRTSPDPEMWSFFGSGFYDSTAAKHVGFLFSSAGIHATVCDGTSITQTLIYNSTVSGVPDGDFVLRINRVGGAIYFEASNATLGAFTATISTGLPSGTMQPAGGVPRHSMVTAQIETDDSLSTAYVARLGNWKMLRKA